MTIQGVTKVVLGVRDQARATKFWSEIVGFPITTDAPYADDIEKTYEELSAKGVEFPAKPEKQPWGWWALFLDSEGNRFALQRKDS
ncbi:VOC family protein [Amycolatopsis sp. NPDC058986]|uniref:VOC family protein n=1 Tax=unclassified Amycolatopsis TaxID=2618356 RepID=UPI00366E7BE6